MDNQTTDATASTEPKNVVKNTVFKSEGDWINRLMTDHCTLRNVGAVEAVEGVKAVKAKPAQPEETDEDGNITKPAVEAVEAVEGVKAVRGKKGKDVTDVDAIKILAKENNIEVKEYPNAGMTRMNVGNMLRAAARKRHGLRIPRAGGLITEDSNFNFKAAPDDFEVNGDTPSHDKNGEKIVVKKAEPAEAAE